MSDRFEDVIRESKAFVESKIIPIITREPRLQLSPREYTHTVKFPGKQRVNSETIVPMIKETLSKEQEISLYVHMPVCRYRCSFCHYPVLIKNRQDEINIWVRNIIKESETYQQQIPEVKNCNVTSLYIGGGTPTLLDDQALELLISHFRKNYRLAENIEITLEGTPDSCSRQKLDFLEKLGVNRVSIGVQTLNDSILHLCKRQHTSREAMECVSTLVDSNIRKVNFDLIYGFPTQTVDNFIADLDVMLSYRPTSITVYRLRLNRSDEGPTAMLRLYEKEPKKFPSLSELYLMQVAARDIAEGYGYHEEPSGWFSRPGHRIQVYKDRWIEQKPMIGFGWHAYSYSKWWEYHNCSDSESYISFINSGKLPMEFGYVYNAVEQQKRFIAFKLKSEFQLNEEEFRSFFGQGLVWNSVINQLRVYGLMEENSLKITPEGKVLIEEFIEKFLIKSLST